MTQTIKPDRATFNSLLEHSLCAFTQRMFSELHPETSLQMNWHIACICWHLEQVEKGNITRLIINLPPRHLKSFVSSVAFPAWYLGRNPGKKVVCVSYSHELSNNLTSSFRRLVRLPTYGSLFSGTFKKGLKNTEQEQVTSAGGSRLATSVGGTLTGKGGDIIIVDDPIRADGALSSAERKSVNEWISNTLITRLNDKRTGAIVLAMQRLHQDDATGYLTQEEDHGWTHLNIPAIEIAPQLYRTSNKHGGEYYERPAGEVLDPSREPREILEGVRREIGSDRFDAQYQGTPVPPGGNIFKRQWIITCEALPEISEADAIIQSIDTAMCAEEHNDYSVFMTFGVFSDRYYLYDVTRQRLEFTELRDTAMSLVDRWYPDIVIIEKAGHGIALRREMFSAMRRRRDRPILFDPTPRGDKATRAAGVSGMLEQGQVIIPNQAVWRPAYVEEILGFPATRHDDQVDSLVQFLRYMQTIRRLPRRRNERRSRAYEPERTRPPDTAAEDSGYYLRIASI